MKLNELTAHEILTLIKAKKTSADEIYDAVLGRIDQCDKDVRAYVRLRGAQMDSDGANGNASQPLPIAIKDNICIRDVETTCCSRILTGFKPPYDATIIAKLKNAGVPIAGQTNMDEFAFGSSTENSCHGPTRNPWNLACVPGGSSGGSAAAVAAHEAIWAIGSDTGGSIRQPASFCGVVGLKPTYGRVSRYGLIAFASSLDQIGPITKDVTDAAILLNIIAGYDPKDSTSVDLPVPDYTRALINDVKGLTIGIPKEYFVEGIDPEVNAAMMSSIEVLKKCGALFKEVSLPHTEYAVATYYLVATAEASSNLARYDGVQYGLRLQPSQVRKTALMDMYEETRDIGFGREAKRRIMLGTYALSSGYYDDYYLRGLKVRTLIKNDFDQVFTQCDAILTPTAPTTAFKIGEKTNDPLAMYLSDIYTISVNLSGVPAVSVPCGFSREGLPIGLQIITKPFDEETLFRLAYTYEQNTDWHKRKAELKTYAKVK
ncbi:MAG TPA: Asp-tRNA(Asn)/Glu-tRNA(Gln) amidotransferase GatCAB subunit A [Candidatus Omnitrophica bacterium]|nr:MAG: aspartyl/glutamyl-tRNA amidotransferase subunit A [Omnitrophica WOR_2 bacterium GWA2_45_18]OGX18629.1 MAG: aspartyl/glutamyl-tRNA amidotransferase subunit A [Omnitrophica WOR_2 bacterium GWC2_45_7]HBR15497.1 Asp-tRNA(Asn)/Glu-tRNA(Gln) amidotransferase GatCAB subunit A [Candidatus Omnitrophota bacterium]